MEHIAVVCVTHNSAEDIMEFLGSLHSSDSGHDVVTEIVIVDNASTDETLAVVRGAQHPKVRLIPSHVNAGYAAGVNLGLASIVGDRHVLVANADIRFLPGSIEALVRALETSDVGIVAPRLVPFSGPAQPSLRRFPTLTTFALDSLLGGSLASRFGVGETLRGGAGGPRYVDWATGAVWLIRAECRRDVGPWDESFFLYSEEVEYALRARAAGWRLYYVPEAKVVHRGGDQRRAPDLYALSVLNRLELFRRQHARPAVGAARMILLAGELLRSRRDPMHKRAARAMAQRRSRERLIERLSSRSIPAGASWLVFAAQDWWYHNQAHSDFQLARNLPPADRVLMVNSLGMRIPSRKNTEEPARRVLRKLKSMGRGIRRIRPSRSAMFVFSPVSIPFTTPRLAGFNAALVAFQIRAACWITGVDPTYILTTLPTALPVIERLPPRPLLYNRSDKHSLFPEGDGAWVSTCEERLVRTADVVLYVSRALMQEEAAQVTGRAEYVGHGVDLGLFDPVGPSFDYEAADVAKPGSPVVGFFGSLDGWLLDFDLFARVCESLPEVAFVVAGDVQGERPDFLSLPNVVYLPRLPYETIASLGRTFDVAVMPWRETDWIRMANPIKLKEYLSLGLPIVSTPFAELEDYEALVYTASGPDDFVRKVRAALAEDDPDLRSARRAAVSQSAWRAISERMESVAASHAEHFHRRRDLQTDDITIVPATRRR